MHNFLSSESLISRADVLTNLFLNPPETGSNGPENSEWLLGTQQQLRWKTNIAKYNLMLYQQLVCSDNKCVNGPVMIKEGLKSDVSSFIWRITTGSLSLSPTNTFFLMIRDVDNGSNEFQSSVLNFTGSEAPASIAPTTKVSPTTIVAISTLSPPSPSPTTSKSITTSTSSSSSSNTISTSPATVTKSGQISVVTPSSRTSAPSTNPISTVTPTPNPNPSPLPPTPLSDPGLSTATKIGIAIGVTLLVVIAIFLGWYLNRRRKARSRKSSLQTSETPSPVDPAQLSGPHELHVPGWGEQRPIVPFTPRELHGNGKFDAVKGVRELEAWEKPGELGNRNLDDFEGMRELEAWDKPGELGDVKLDDFEYVRELETWERPGELGNRNLDDFEGVRELEARERPAELGDWRRSGIKSGIYELES